ncbi:unnamed protein product [Moneuplotes crassus]|uniref:Uncharacterized protein n=1 Tax=Euplotes crassus TaxID=5936 RepID=A0AAD1UBE6_EUPCR|nr:unnamed protein product [Moneuplotes crassus]
MEDQPQENDVVMAKEESKSGTEVKDRSSQSEGERNEQSHEEQMERDLKLIRGYWKLPAITQFIKTFHPLLGINEMTPTELEQCILKPDVDGTMGIFIKALLQKSTNTDPEIPEKLTGRPASVYHVPVLNDMNDYQPWNEKLAKKINYLHILYKRFIKKYGLKELTEEEKANIPNEVLYQMEDITSKDSGITYSSNIRTHLLDPQENEPDVRFVHYDMSAFTAETLSTVTLFEDMDGVNPFRDKEVVSQKDQQSEKEEAAGEGEGEDAKEEYKEEPADSQAPEENSVENRLFHEIPIKNRADIILYLCHQKAGSHEYSKFVKKIRKEEIRLSKMKRHKIDKLSNSESRNSEYMENESTGGWCDTEPILIGEASTSIKYFFFQDHRDCRVYSQQSEFDNLELETNSPEELKELIQKLKDQDVEDEEKQKKKEEEEEKKKKGRRKTRQSSKKASKTKKKPDLQTNKELIQELESLIPVFIENQEEYHKRQAILARKMQTLERSRMLLTKKRTRQADKELEPEFISGRVTRSRLKDLNKTEEEKDVCSSKNSTGYKDSGQIQTEFERQKRKNIEAFDNKNGTMTKPYITHEKSAREQRRQKRVLRNELPTSENRDEFKNINWSNREIFREFTRVKSLRRREKNKRKKMKARYTSRKRKGSINTEEETDLFEDPEDFEWPDADIDISVLKQQSTNSGRQVTKPENKDDEDDNTQSLKIMMEANIYRLLGKQEQGLEEMKIFCSKDDYHKKTDVPHLKGNIWIKGEWVLSGDKSRSKMEYTKNKNFSQEIHGQMIQALKQLIIKRDAEKKQAIETHKNLVKTTDELNSNKEETKEVPDSSPPSSKLSERNDKPVLMGPPPSQADSATPEAIPASNHHKVFLIQKDFQHRTQIQGHPVDKQLFRLLKEANGVYEGFFCYEDRFISEKIVLENSIEFQETQSTNQGSSFKKFIKTVGYGENNIGFFMLEGKAELSPDENRSKMVYFDTYNNEELEQDSEESQNKKKPVEIEEMEQYLGKKKLLCNRIGKLKFVRYYMEKPEIKKRRRRERKKKAKDKEEKDLKVKDEEVKDMVVANENESKVKQEDSKSAEDKEGNNDEMQPPPLSKIKSEIFNIEGINENLRQPILTPSSSLALPPGSTENPFMPSIPIEMIKNLSDSSVSPSKTYTPKFKGSSNPFMQMPDMSGSDRSLSQFAGSSQNPMIYMNEMLGERMDPNLQQMHPEMRYNSTQMDKIPTEMNTNPAQSQNKQRDEHEIDKDMA